MAVKKSEKAAGNAAQELGGGLGIQAKPMGGFSVDTGGMAKGIVRLAYIGPTLPIGQLMCNKVFVGTMEGIQSELADALEAYPLAWKLMVPVEKMGEKKARAGTEGTILNKYYSCIVSEIAANKAKEG